MVSFLASGTFGQLHFERILTTFRLERSTLRTYRQTLFVQASFYVAIECYNQ